MVSRVMISVRVGPASTWQWVQVWLHSLPTLTCSVSIRSARRVSCPYSASVASNERRSLAVLFSGLRRTVTLAMRSEEHTSELQSRLHLVCRLLLEKKKKTSELDYQPDLVR